MKDGAYRISSNKCPRRLLSFETAKCSTYKRAALIRGRHLFQSQEKEQYEVSKPCDFFFQNKSET